VCHVCTFSSNPVIIAAIGTTQTVKQALKGRFIHIDTTKMALSFLQNTPTYKREVVHLGEPKKCLPDMSKSDSSEFTSTYIQIKDEIYFKSFQDQEMSSTPKDNNDLDSSLFEQNDPLTLATTTTINNNNTSEGTQPGAIAISSSHNQQERLYPSDYRSLMAPSDGSMTFPPSVIVDAPNTTEEIPSNSRMSDMTPDIPIIIATLVNSGPPSTIYEHDGVPEAIPTTIWNDRRVQLVLTCLIILIVISMSIIVTLLTKEVKMTSTVPIIPTSQQPIWSWSPSSVPTLPPSNVEQTIMDILHQAAAFDDGTALKTSSSSQNLAFEKIIQDSEATSYSASRLIQRYALLTLWFSLIASDTDESSAIAQPLPADECIDFEYVDCDANGNVISFELTWKSQPTGRVTLPNEIGLLTKLTRINLEGNSIQGTLPTTLGLLTNLQSLGLRWNRFTGVIPTYFEKLTHLTDVGLDHNLLTGSVPSTLAKLSFLTWLSLAENALTGSLPSQLWSLKNLHHLCLSSNQLTGYVSTFVGQLKDLRLLSLAENQFTGILPKELMYLSRLTNLDIGGNNFTGVVPTEFLETMTELMNLNLANNKFSGPIPSTLALLTNLSESLLLNNNRFISTVPSVLSRLRLLSKGMDLSYNQLTGSIPSELGWLSNLSSLLLGNNQLQGSIPTHLGSLVNLTLLGLEQNPNLMGSLPTEFGQLTKLQKLSLFGISLTGSVPTSVCDLRRKLLETLEVDCTTACTCCSDFCF
jgi:Leucine-rich repeat (LRR) protein